MLVAGKGRVDIVNTTDSSSLATSARAKGYRGSDELHTETVNGSRLQAEGNVTVHCWGQVLPFAFHSGTRLQKRLAELIKNGGIRLCLILKPDSLLQAAGAKGKNWPRR
jgi:hypothetical protein